jgi:hypothetical protein
MASRYAAPKEIRDMWPEGTTVKTISGHYNMYEQSSVKGAEGPDAMSVPYDDLVGSEAAPLAHDARRRERAAHMLQVLRRARHGPGGHARPATGATWTWATGPTPRRG